MTARPIVEIDGLSVRRQGKAILERLDLAVPRGTIHALVGPNGAGKSTLLSVMLGLVEFDGKVLLHFEGNGRIGYIPQAFAPDQTLPMTAEEFLALSRQRRPVCFGLKRAVREKARELLAMVGIAHCATRQLSVLSGGELRRVLLANALDPAPELLLSDEPAAGLDQGGLTLLDQLLTEARDKHGTTIVLVSHDARQVERIADGITTLGVA